MLQKIKKTIAILTIIVLFPYIITIFVNGGETKKEETNGKNELLKTHCISLLAKEVSSDYEDEMLKVQAILVRTTVYKEVEEKGQSILSEENIGDVSEINTIWYNKLEQIWDETENLVIMYNEKLALVPFHQVSNGKTRDGKEVLGSEDYPYLQIKECPKDVEAPNQMESKFIEAKDAKIESVDSAGYVLTVKTGEETCSGESFRETFQLASSCFEVQPFTENTRVLTKGVGHGLGLSQYTANEMAKEGQSYQEIISFFFTGTEIKEVAEIIWDVDN